MDTEVPLSAGETEPGELVPAPQAGLPGLTIQQKRGCARRGWRARRRRNRRVRRHSPVASQADEDPVNNNAVARSGEMDGSGSGASAAKNNAAGWWRRKRGSRGGRRHRRAPTAQLSVAAVIPLVAEAERLCASSAWAHCPGAPPLNLSTLIQDRYDDEDDEWSASAELRELVGDDSETEGETSSDSVDMNWQD